MGRRYIRARQTRRPRVSLTARPTPTLSTRSRRRSRASCRSSPTGCRPEKFNDRAVTRVRVLRPSCGARPNCSISPRMESRAPDLRDRADMLALAGDFEHAVPLYRELSAANPNDAGLQRKLAGALDAAGAAEEAIACYRRALALDSTDARAHDELGRLLGRRGDMKSASEHLRAAVKLDPSLVTARGALGDLLCREGRFAEGTAELKAALALDPGSWPLALRLGTALASSGAERQGEAMDCFRRVIALSPANAVAHLQLGLAFWRRGDAAPAIALAERAARLDPKLAAAH